MMTNVLYCIASSAAAAVIIRLMISNAERLGLVQPPVARSSHKRPTPTGGGVGIVVGAVFGCLAFAGSDPVALGLCGLGVVIAVLGLIDDRTPLPARVRLLVQAGAVVGAILLADIAPSLFGAAYGMLWPLAAVLLLLAGIWWINLFNFMDGIDGIAGQQAALMLFSAMVITWGSESSSFLPFWWMMAAVLLSTLAFVAFNWPPARIFMGDAGSTFLAFVLFGFALISISAGEMTVVQWLLLASLFATDATVTLLVRFFRREKVTQAHRSHAYQRLSRRMDGALPVTAGAAFVNLALILPIAFCLPASPFAAYSILVAVYAAVGIGCLWLGAGLRDDETGGHFRFFGVRD